MSGSFSTQWINITLVYQRCAIESLFAIQICDTPMWDILISMLSYDCGITLSAEIFTMGEIGIYRKCLHDLCQSFIQVTCYKVLNSYVIWFLDFAIWVIKLNAMLHIKKLYQYQVIIIGGYEQFNRLKYHIYSDWLDNVYYHDSSRNAGISLVEKVAIRSHIMS